MGVEQRFYAPFAAWLAERGYLAITFDYLGMGQSRNGSLRGLEVDVLGWARHDCSAMLAAALAESGSKPLYWIGHSLGGQILPFVEGRAYREGLQHRQRQWLLEGKQPAVAQQGLVVLVPRRAPADAAARLFSGRRLGMVGDLPRGVIEQWRRWCLHPQYALADGEAIRRALSAVRTPIVSLSFTDDEIPDAASSRCWASTAKRRKPPGASLPRKSAPATSAISASSGRSSPNRYGRATCCRAGLRQRPQPRLTSTRPTSLPARIWLIAPAALRGRSRAPPLRCRASIAATACPTWMP